MSYQSPFRTTRGGQHQTPMEWLTIFYHPMETEFPEDWAGAGELPWNGLSIRGYKRSSSRNNKFSWRTKPENREKTSESWFKYVIIMVPGFKSSEAEKCSSQVWAHMPARQFPAPRHRDSVPVESCSASQNKGVGNGQRLGLTRLTNDQVSVDRRKLLQLSVQSGELQKCFSIRAVKGGTEYPKPKKKKKKMLGQIVGAN